MRLANAVALGLSLLLLASTSPPAEARRGYGFHLHQRAVKAERRAARRIARRLSQSRARLVKARARIAASSAARQAPSPIPPVKPSDNRAAILAQPAEALERNAVSIAAQTALPVPGPTLVNTVTYDFIRGQKTMSLRDGSVFVEEFDPDAFFRLLPETQPSTTSSTLAAATGRRDGSAR